VIGYIFYSHYEYSDVWPMMKGQVDKYFKGRRKILFTNKIGDYDFSEWEVVLYDESLSYQKRVASCLEKINDEYVILHHEDMIFVNKPEFEIIEEQLLPLVKKEEIDIIKFCKACYQNTEHEKMGKNLFRNPKNLSYAVQPALVRKKLMHKITNNTNGSNIWKFEANSVNIVNFLNYNSAYYHDGTEEKRGMFHWDSSIYPYLNSGILKGKWDYFMYRKELSNLMGEYGINPRKRGIHE